MRKKLQLFSFFCFFTASVWSQTTTVNYAVPFSTNGQSMWGTGSGFSLNLNQELFRFNPSINYDSGSGGITSLGGYDFGAGIAVNFWMDIGSNFIIDGLTLGTVDVNYPIDVNLTMPAANSFEKGDTVTVNTGYIVNNGWDLSTHYPTGGNTSLNLHFGFGLDVNLTLCAFGCTTIPIIPNLQLPVQTIDIFALHTMPPPITTTYPCTLFSPCGGAPLPPCIPNICHSNITPLNFPSNGLGISGSVDIPYVVTTDSDDPATHCLAANGSSQYMTLTLDIFAFLDNFASRIPPPAGTAISAVLGNLSNSFSLPFGASLDYTIFAAQFNVHNTNNQDFSFCPKIASHFDFPFPVHYYLTDPTSGNAMIGSYQYGTTVNFNLGDDVHFKYPCNYEFVDVTPSFDISHSGNNFSNHTYDVISFDFTMQALSFSFVLPEITIIPQICFPEICITLCYPDPSWSDPFNWSCDDVCTPAFCTPALVFPGFNLSFGPLLDETIPLGALPPINYFNSSWNLGGFTPQTMQSFQLIPRDYSASMIGTNIACKGDSIGSATVSVTNGRAPYTYLWDNLTSIISNTTSNTMNGLEANPHYAVVTNNNGCVAMASTTLTEPTNYLTIPTYTEQDVACNGGNTGQITVAPQGGTGSYTYSWTSNVSNAAVANNLIAGNYTVIVTDANGCDTNRTITVAEPLLLTSSTTSQNVSCNGGSDGSIDLSVAGGSTPYSYSWSNGATAQDLEAIPLGNYTYTVTDGKGCSINNTVPVTQPNTPVSITLNSITNVLCKNGNNGAIDITASGGTPPYTYHWENAANVVLSSTSDTILNLSGGVYKIIVTDSKNCSNNATYTIIEPAQAIAASSTTVNVSCFGGNDGSVNLTVTGGTGAYSYNWSNATVSQDLSAITQGTYSVIITDANSCTALHVAVITEPPVALTAVITPTKVLCFGGNTGAAVVSISGGTPPYTNVWSTSAVTLGINNLIAGNYSVTVTDAKGCTQLTTTVVTQPAAPLAVNNSITAVSCYAGSNGAIDITVTGGTSPYYYQWSNADSVIFSSTLEDVANVKSSNYTVLISDTNACTILSNFTVTQPASPISIHLTATNVNCFAGNNGAITAIPAGGTPPYTYSWSNGNANATNNLLVAGQYTVLVTDANGCTKTASAFITQPETALTASTTGYNIKCPGGNDGTIDLTVAGGVLPYSYSWNTGAITQDLNLIIAGVYAVSVTDGNGCIATSGAVLTEPANPIAITTVVDSVTCFGYSNGSISVSVSGGTFPYQIQWADSIYLMNNSMNSQLITNLDAGNYFVRVTDGNGCMASQSLVVYQPAPLALTNTITPITCNGGSDGAIAITVTGGTLAYHYFWQDSTTIQNQIGLPAGYYDVAITDYHDCKIKSNHYEVQEPPAITVTLDVTQITCIGEHDATIAATAYGGVGNFTYVWSNGASVSQLQNLSADTYILTTTDANNCTKSDTVVINQSTLNCFEIPNTITPNGDGKNDTWIIPYIWLYPNVTVKIFNQWGNLLFESSGYAVPWDGMYKDKPLPSATYYYIIDLQNGEPAYNGPITIVR